MCGVACPHFGHTHCPPGTLRQRGRPLCRLPGRARLGAGRLHLVWASFHSFFILVPAACVPSAVALSAEAPVPPATPGHQKRILPELASGEGRKHVFHGATGLCGDFHPGVGQCQLEWPREDAADDQLDAQIGQKLCPRLNVLCVDLHDLPCSDLAVVDVGDNRLGGHIEDRGDPALPIWYRDLHALGTTRAVPSLTNSPKSPIGKGLGGETVGKGRGIVMQLATICEIQKLAICPIMRYNRLGESTCLRITKKRTNAKRSSSIP